jgi:hypothetical protein
VKTLIFLGMAAAVLLVATSATAADNPRAKNSCFRSQDWDGWSAPEPGDVLYLRVNKDIYRVGLAPGSHVRKDIDRFLVNKMVGSDYICSPLDMQLTLADHEGFSEPVLATSLRKLTPEEAAAIPPKDRP